MTLLAHLMLRQIKTLWERQVFFFTTNHFQSSSHQTASVVAVSFFPPEQLQHILWRYAFTMINTQGANAWVLLRKDVRDEGFFFFRCIEDGGEKKQQKNR